MTGSSPQPGDNDPHHDKSPTGSSSAGVALKHPPASDATTTGPMKELRVSTGAGATSDDETDDTLEQSSDEDGEREEEGEEEAEEGEEESEDEDEEPKLKYARLTQHLGPLYRNGDATSTFLVAGDKQIIGTHNGNIVGIPNLHWHETV